VVQPTAPWNVLSEAVFNSELSQQVHKDDTTEFKHEVVQETVSKLGPAAIEIYTDASVFRGCREGGAGALIIDNHNQEEHLVEAPAGSATSIYRAEMVAISVALQKVVKLQEKSLAPKEARINLHSDSRSAIQKLAKATRKEEIVHHVLSLVEQIAAGGNAPVDFSTAKTVIRHHCARKWSRMAKPAVLHATYVNRDQDKGLYTFTKDSAFTPLYKRTYTRAGMVPQQNYEKPRPA